MPTYIRVKDLPNAATSPASDDFILLSGTANGARRISRADFLSAVAGFYTADPSTYKLATLDAGDKVLVSQLPSAAFSYKGTWAASSNTPSLANGTGTAGDTYYASDSGSVNFGAGSISFLAGDAVVYDGTIWQKVPDVVNLLDGKGTLDEAKTTLEIPDVGLQPNQVPLSGQLGTMAFQDADGVSMAKAEIESTTGTATTQALTVTDGTDTNFVVQEDGKTGIGTATISNKLTVEPNDNDGILIDSNNDSRTGYLYFGDASSKTVGAVSYDHYSDSLRFNTAGTQRWSINSTGNLVAGANLGIDFGSTSDGSGAMSSELLDDYEEGTWTPSFSVTSGAFTTMTMDVVCARYVKVGHLVNFYCYIRTNNVNTTGTGGNLIVTGLPYGNAGSNNFPACSVGYAEGWANSPSAGYVVTGGSFIYLTKRNTSITGDLQEMTASDMTAGAVTNENQLMLSGSYYSF